MKTILKLVLALCLMVGSMTSAWAANSAGCPAGQALRKIGTAQTDSAAVSTQGEEVRAVSLQCGATACVSGLYDATTVGGATSSNLVLDLGAAANTSILFPETGFLDAPLSFKTGLTFIDNGNVNQITFLGCQPE